MAFYDLYLGSGGFGYLVDRFFDYPPCMGDEFVLGVGRRKTGEADVGKMPDIDGDEFCVADTCLAGGPLERSTSPFGPHFGPREPRKDQPIRGCHRDDGSGPDAVTSRQDLMAVDESPWQRSSTCVPDGGLEEGIVSYRWRHHPI